MDKTRKQFLFNLEWVEVLMGYPKEVRYEVYDAIMRYVQSGEISELKPTAKMAFSFIKKEIDYNDEKYQSVCEKNKANGKKGGRPKKDDKTQKSERFSEKRSVLEKPKKPNGFSVFKNEKNTPLYDNDNDIKSDNELSLHKGRVEDVFENFFSDNNKITLEGYCMNLKISIDELRKLGEMVRDEWILGKEPDVSARHFVSVIRYKLNNQRMNDLKTNETKQEDRFSKRRGINPVANRAEDYSDTL